MATRDEVLSLVSAGVEALTEDLKKQIASLTQQFANLTTQKVETYEPVKLGVCRGSSLDLIKSLPEFRGDMQSYPAWRDAAHFAIGYYTEGSENYYIAVGILRNKITGTANDKLSSFNTVLNFRAIIARLDQSFADKRSLQVLENELSILRQGKLSISDFYDAVDKHLTLIINKNRMSYPENEDIANALNERARDNGLRVFISGLRKPLSDILFSAKPCDLPTALATAQELESDQRRQEFAKIFAEGSISQTYRAQQKSNITPITHPAYKRTTREQNKNGNRGQQQDPVPMDVDPGSSMFRRQTMFTGDQTQQAQFSGNSAAKRDRETGSGRSAPAPKQHRVNHITTDPPEEEEEDEVGSVEQFAQYEDDEEEQIVEELNFLD